MTNYSFASESLIGGRSENQDCFLTMETKYGFLAIVCDGMGGMNGGRIAAELAVKVIIDQLLSGSQTGQREALTSAISQANATIFHEGRSTPGLKGMGTTITALLIDSNHAIACHVGDSRIYHLRDGNKLFRTFDHSLVFELMSLGILTEEEARTSPQSNVITRALGTHPNIEITISDEMLYKKSDRFLLCTDGIWGALPEPELLRMAASHQPVNEALKELVTFVDSLGAEKGGMHDNMTGILIEVLTDSL